MDEEDLFDLEIEGSPVSASPAVQVEAASPQRSNEARTSEHVGEFKAPSASGEKLIPKRRQQLEDLSEREIRVGKLTVGSLPIKIPMSASLTYRRDAGGDSPDDPSIFVPPHELSQRAVSVLEQGSVPEAGHRTSLLRQRNKIFQQTGFLDSESVGFVINRVSTGITPESLNGSSMGGGFIGGSLPTGGSMASENARRGALALALTPVPEQVSMGSR